MKKLFSLISVLAVAGLGVGLLAACSEKEEEHVHSYTSSVTTAATCTEDGVMTYTCSCGDSYTEVIKASGHVVGDWVITVAPTCTEKGTQVKSCTVCGEVIETESIEALGHTWGAAVYSVVEEQIVWTRTCEVCGAVEELSHEDLADLEEAPVLEASSEDALVAGLTVDGATVVLAPEVDETTGEATIEVSESLKIAPADGEDSIDVTIVVGEGSTLATSGESLESTSENESTPGLIDVQKGASLTLELGEGSSVTGASGDAYDSAHDNAYHDGLISVGEGGSIVINADNNSDVTQTNPYGAVINIDTGGSCEINGGRYSVEGAKEYTVVNDGDMVINDGVFVTTNSGSSLIINGDDHDTAGYEDHDHSLVINGGEFYGGKHVVKNSLHGYLEINDGVFDGFLGTYTVEGSEVEVGASDDLLDNEDATAVINGGVFGEGTAEMLEEGETGQFEVTITVKGGHEETNTGDNDGFVSTVTINGGTFYKGNTALFAFGDSRTVKGEPASALDQLHILPEVFEVIQSDLDSGSYDIASTVNEAGYYVIAGAAADSGDTGN